MREFRMDDTSSLKGTLYLNGEPIILRGADTMGNFEVPVMKGDEQQLIEDILIAKLAHLNFFRLTREPRSSPRSTICATAWAWWCKPICRCSDACGGLSWKSAIRQVRRDGESWSAIIPRAFAHLHQRAHLRREGKLSPPRPHPPRAGAFLCGRLLGRARL